MKKSSPLKHDVFRNNMPTMHSHGDAVESYVPPEDVPQYIKDNPNFDSSKGAYMVNGVLQEGPPEWLVTYEDIQNLKTPSHDKVDKKDIKRIYLKLKSQGHSMETIQKVINGVKKKRYNSYAAGVKKYNSMLA